MEKYKQIEKSIIKKFRKEIWSKFIKSIKEYKLINENDKLMICISGGKDSFLLAKLIQELQKHGKIKFEAIFTVMDPGYKKEHINLIKQNAKTLNIPITIFKTNIFKVINKIAKDNPCYLCAKMRRGYLYDYAQNRGCNKLVLGHHFDDVIETTLLSMLYSAEIKTMMPKLKSTNFKGLELIRPLYQIKEKDIIAWGKYNKLEFLNCACINTKKNLEKISKRKEIKTLIENLRKNNKDIDHNIFKALDNVNINCILGYKENGKYKSFLDEYKKTNS